MPADEGVNVGNPAGFIADQIRSGVNATNALEGFREAGGGMRRQSWFRLYGEVADSIARSPEAAALDPAAYPDAENYGEWAAGQGGQYATQVNIMIRDRASGVVGSAPYTHITDDPHTPDEAIAAGVDLYSNDDAAQRYDQQILGGVVTGIWQTIPFGSA